MFLNLSRDCDTRASGSGAGLDGLVHLFPFELTLSRLFSNVKSPVTALTTLTTKVEYQPTT